MNFLQKRKDGFTFMETIISVTIFLILSISFYQIYSEVSKIIEHSRIKITATILANEQIEIIRNLSYEDVGNPSGIPNGVITKTQTLTKNNRTFSVDTTIRNVDDVFDGVFPDDLSPADYKFVEITISYPEDPIFTPLKFSTKLTPVALETSSGNGALFVRVFDAFGQPVTEADVTISNTTTNPNIYIEETTDNDGYVKIIDVPPATQSYAITVTKDGYSSDQTHSITIENPNPIKNHSTVAMQQLTQISFAIDETSSINISTRDQSCNAIGSINFDITGTKLIGTNPDIIKYENSFETNAEGIQNINNIEWDNYNIDTTETEYYLAGSIPFLPITIDPGTNQDLKLVLREKVPNGLLIAVKDGITGLPISNALVNLTKTGFEQNLYTGRGFEKQTDWSQGEGEENFTEGYYYTSDGNIEKNLPDGDLKLKDVFGNYSVSGNLTSSSYDLGVESNFHQITWEPKDQPVETGTNSVKFQIATNNDQTTWNFLGPDGTSSTYYTLAEQNINPIHNGDRYIRYKLFLSTENTAHTPIISDVAFTFTSSCLPSGQVFFDNINTGTYDIEISKDGFASYNDEISVSSGWQSYQITLNP